jgi:predicted PurR-regulated permease PerM
MTSLATALLFVIVAVFALIAVGMLAIVAIALIKLNKQLEKLTNLAEPLAVKASDTLEQVQRVTMSVGEKADQILTRGVDLTDNVSTNVERTANVVRQTVTKPLIKLSSVIAGVSKTIAVYSGTSRHNGHS